MTTSSDEQLSNAFILHLRKYRDTSVIAELLTQSEGRLGVVIRGARSRRSRYSSRLQPFVPLLISWYGRGELKTAKAVDFPASAFHLTGDSLMVGLYANELLYRLLGKFDPVPGIFACYRDLLASLEASSRPNAELRYFELTLLAELGYGITFDLEAATGEPVQPDRRYRYVTEEGFHPLATEIYDELPAGTFEGAHLLAVARGELDDPAVERSARQITRASLKVLLGGRPLKSREILLKKKELL